jgi:hypothetical protein
MGQLHALSRFATAEGAEDLALPATAAWAVPGWGDADLVYVTYGKIWCPLFLAFTLCAFLIYNQRRPGQVGSTVLGITPFSTRFGAPVASPPAGSVDSPGVVDLASHLPGQCGAPGDVRLRDPRASAGFGFCGCGPPGHRGPSALVRVSESNRILILSRDVVAGLVLR